MNICSSQLMRLYFRSKISNSFIKNKYKRRQESVCSFRMKMCCRLGFESIIGIILFHSPEPNIQCIMSFNVATWLNDWNRTPHKILIWNCIGDEVKYRRHRSVPFAAIAITYKNKKTNMNKTFKRKPNTLQKPQNAEQANHK